MGMRLFSTMVFIVMVWLGPIGVSGSKAMVHAQDSFDGNRLFFTEAQRKKATVKESEISSGSLSNAAGNKLEDVKSQTRASITEYAKADSPGTRQHSFPTARPEDPTNMYNVYFTGLVTGKREPRILVNGLPCKLATGEYVERSGQPLPIDCHGIRSGELSLTVSIVSGTLLVTDRGGRVHHLLPGEGM